MNRIDRIAAILIQLQSKKTVKAQEIAERFSISLRTVYRDIKALEASGVPVGGEAGIGYSLMEGYRLPPVQFTKEEAMAFLTAEKMVEKLTDASSRKHYSEAMLKIKAVLRYTEKNMLEEMDHHIEVLENPYLPSKENNPGHLQTLLQGIRDRQLLSIGYFANHTQQYSNRDIEPVGIFFMTGNWYLIGYCHMRQDYRHFRTDRISYIHTTGRYFEQQHPSLKSFLEKMKQQEATHTVVIRLEKDVIKYFGEQKYYNGFVSQKEIDGQIEMMFVTASLTGFAKFYLLFGEYAEIISPDALKELVQKNIKSLQEKLALQKCC